MCVGPASGLEMRLWEHLHFVANVLKCGLGDCVIHASWVHLHLDFGHFFVLSDYSPVTQDVFSYHMEQESLHCTAVRAKIHKFSALAG